MDRQRALQIIEKYTTKDITYRHLISVGAVMRALAPEFRGDELRWELAGLFHDLDYDTTGDDLARHTELTLEWLRAEGYDDADVLNAVVAHKDPRFRTDQMSKVIAHADAVAGLLVAAALVRPEKAHGMKVSSVKKKLKEKSFAPGVEREDIHNVEESIGLPLDRFIEISIGGIQEVAPELGLEPAGAGAPASS